MDKIYKLIYNFFLYFGFRVASIRRISYKYRLFLFSIRNFFSGARLRGELELIFSNDFERYIFQKGNDFSMQLMRLKNEMDAQSVELIDQTIERQRYIHTHNILEQKKITNQEEKKLQSDIYEKLNQDRLPLDERWEAETLAFHFGLKFIPKEILEIKKRKTVLDMGAFTGDSAYVFRKKYNFGKIYAFEPENENYDKLLKNIKKYEISDVVAVKKAAGKHQLSAKLKNEGFASAVSDLGNQTIEVVSVDNFLEGKSGEIGLIKMDIEGMEFDAIVGMKKIIKRDLPILIISIYHRGKDFFEIKPYLEDLTEYKYNFIVRKINPFTPALEIILIAWLK